MSENENVIPNIQDLTIQCKGVEKLLDSSDPSKACGPDKIPTRILKDVAIEIAPILTVIFNKTISTGVVPSSWRKGNIVAVYKGKGRKDQAANYRPISLTSVPCKILEHVIYKHIMDHCKQYNIILDNQHGFRAKRSCETQLIETIEDIARSRNFGNVIDLLILDFSKAFDTVPHKKLLLKLDIYGIGQDTSIGKWISSWLNDRSQNVMLDGESSSAVRVESGVPQGTVLGPLMFLLFINDIANKVEHSRIRLFADDCLLFREVNNENEYEKLQNDFDAVGKWAKEWQMKFNVEKCYRLQISGKKASCPYLYSLNNEVLGNVQHHPYLGVEFDKDLKWGSYVENVVNKANRSLGFIKRNLSMCPKEIKRAAYYTLVRPQLEYASAAWDPHLKTQKESIERVQRKAARFVTNEHSREEGTMTKLLRDLEWSTLEARRSVNRLTFFYKILNKHVDIELPHYVTPQKRNSRGSDINAPKFVQISTIRDIYKYSFYPRTIVEWNSLPPEVRRIKNINSFKDRCSMVF